MNAVAKKLFCIITSLIMVCVLCTVPVSAASPKLNKTSANVPIGYSITLSVKNADEVSWSSKDSSVAKIKSTDGNTAKIVGKKTGSTYIYAKTGGKTLKCKVTVKKSFISPSADSVSLDEGGKKTVTLTVTGDKTIAYANSDSDVCSVSWGKWDGNKIKLTIKAKSAGTAKIKVYAKGYSKSTVKTITVTVNGSESVSSSGSATEQVVALVNEKRAAAGKSALESDSKLNEIAEMRAKEIAEYFSHTRPDGTSCFTALEENGIVNVYMGENIAAGQRSAEEVMQSWMSSSGHKANILDGNFTKIGVGLYKSSSGYGYYWVQVFTSDY